MGELTTLPPVSVAEVKRLLVGALRSELTWAGKRIVPELEILYRSELEKESADWEKVWGAEFNGCRARGHFWNVTCTNISRSC